MGGPVSKLEPGVIRVKNDRESVWMPISGNVNGAQHFLPQRLPTLRIEANSQDRIILPNDSRPFRPSHWACWPETIIAIKSTPELHITTYLPL